MIELTLRIKRTFDRELDKHNLRCNNETEYSMMLGVFAYGWIAGREDLVKNHERNLNAIDNGN